MICPESRSAGLDGDARRCQGGWVRILFVGAGATGGYFGGRLVAAGRDVTFLVRPQRAAVLAERGLRIIDPDGRTRIEPRLITAGGIDGHYDVVLVAIKSYALEQAMLDMAPAVGPRTVVVPLLNGMRHIDELLGAFGEEHVYGGVCMIHATLDEAGDVVQLTGLHRLGFGPLDGDDDGRLKAVTAALSGAGFDSRPSATIVQDMWEKWVFLAGLGAATTLMRSSVGAINAAARGPAFMAGIADEVVAVAAAAGHRPRDGAVAFLRAGVSSTAPTTSSLYRDMSQGLPVEADAIIGDIVTEGDKHGVPTPLRSAAYTPLSI
jgi:2-dehydropantoate 2-reductase